MKDRITLTVTSLLSILFMTLHLADDIVRWIEPEGLPNLVSCSFWRPRANYPRHRVKTAAST